jgi:hypothetical protein
VDDDVMISVDPHKASNTAAVMDPATKVVIASQRFANTPAGYRQLDLVAQEAFGAFAADRDAYDDVASVDEWIVLTTSGTLRLREFYASHPGLAALIQATATRDRDREKVRAPR